MNIIDKNKRLDYIDLTKGFAILLVVLGHIYGTSNPIKVWIYSFHMPLFFIISGFFAKRDLNLSDLFKKRLKSLFLPYVMFSIAIIILNIIISRGITTDIKTYIVYFITLVGKDALWFLPTLFIIEILFGIIHKYIKGINLRISIIVLLFFIGLYGNGFYNSMMLTVVYRSLVGLGFFSIGNYTYKSIDKINISYIYLAIVFIITIGVSKYNGCMDIWGAYFNDRLLYIVNSILGSFLLIFFFKNISTITNKLNVLKFFGVNTLIIMSTQQVVINYISMIVKRDSYSTISGFIIFLIVMVIEVPIIYLINNYLPFMIGKFKKK